MHFGIVSQNHRVTGRERKCFISPGKQMNEWVSESLDRQVGRRIERWMEKIDRDKQIDEWKNRQRAKQIDEWKKIDRERDEWKWHKYKKMDIWKMNKQREAHRETNRQINGKKQIAREANRQMNGNIDRQ